MTEELEVLKQVCQDLEKAEIAYMITGSTGANFYAVSRMTRDIDSARKNPELVMKTLVDSMEVTYVRLR